jgi:hypothetical protein
MLIELAVAAMVIAIGLLALLGLAHIGERAVADAENETRAALFADEIFTTLRLYSDQVSTHADHQGWLDFWTRVSKGELIFPVAMNPDEMDRLEDTDWRQWGLSPTLVADGTGLDAQIHTNVWAFEEDQSVPDFAFQYRLMISRPISGGGVPFLQPGDSFPTNTVWATLHVWNGKHRRHAEPFTFYTHFGDPGGLP